MQGQQRCGLLEGQCPNSHTFTGEDHHALTWLMVWESQQTGNILQISTFPFGTSPILHKIKNIVYCSNKGQAQKTSLH